MHSHRAPYTAIRLCAGDGGHSIQPRLYLATMVQLAQKRWKLQCRWD